MDLSTQMKSTAFAKKLREHIAVLKRRKSVADKRYGEECFEWRKQLGTWLRSTGAARIQSMTSTQMSQASYGCPVENSWFWEGAPKKPSKPNIEKKIHECQRMLRQLGITGQATVKIGPSEIEKFFGADDEDE